MIVFTALDKEGGSTEFAYALSSIEAEFDFLSSLVAKGHTLLTVQLLDGSDRTDLPLAAFDGLPFSTFMEELHQEWLTTLRQPCQTDSSRHQELIRLTRLRIDQIEVAISAHERMIACSMRWLQRTQTSYLSDSRKTRLILRYESMIDFHKQQLRRARCRSQLIVNRLSHLLA
ncbi:hypothetical protein GK091_24820 [Spirosoma agri]|uniref:Uncharacterized protein n=1 Tax=Spirosoma agri TaxID=1987381 RepID=A0A6M0ISR5_9BACT|nr:hypothetical protein [Spirosoma agri]NEU70123.1 hypothetical protein [Spirosoma agri]